MARCASALALVATVLLGACSTLPKNDDRTPSLAFEDTGHTPLGRVAAASARGDARADTTAPEVMSKPGTDAPPLIAPTASVRSGFRLITSGEEAFATLHTLIVNAQRSLDLQYYIVQDDPYARALLRAAREAAERGVRVRLLIDDFYTTGRDDRIAWYASHPNIEVRVFNPFGRGRPWLITRLAWSITDIRRINHRMHNKMLVADNAFAVTGGRNLGAEYYTHSDRTNFIDLDVLAAGPVVHELSDTFDTYWNSRYAFPIENLMPRGWVVGETVDARALSDPADPVVAATAEARDTGRPLQAEIDGGRVALVDAPGVLIADLPTKVGKTAPVNGAHGLVRGATIATDVVSIAKNAKRELVIVSPYFVPGQRGLDVIRGLIDQGVKVRIYTNSLAATDATIVHTGYVRYRLPLLKMGAEVYEVRPDPGTGKPRLGALGSSKASLHAKVMIVDRQTVFLGSFNTDQRSALENTEMGIELSSATIATQILERIRERGDDARFRVTLDERGHMRWTTTDDGVPKVYDDEPEAGTMLKFALKVLAPFAPEELL